MIDRRPLPNLFTIARLVAIPILWVLALQGRTRTVAVVLAIAISTDVIDGQLARRLGVKSDLGSHLDSIADHLLTASTVVWVCMLRPEFVAENWRILVAWGALALVTLIVGWVRFRRIGDLHLYSAKLAMVVGYVFVTLLLFTGDYPKWFFTLTVVLLFVAVGETLLVLLTTERWRRVGSYFAVGRGVP